MTRKYIAIASAIKIVQHHENTSSHLPIYFGSESLHTQNLSAEDPRRWLVSQKITSQKIISLRTKTFYDEWYTLYNRVHLEMRYVSLICKKRTPSPERNWRCMDQHGSICSRASPPAGNTACRHLYFTLGTPPKQLHIKWIILLENGKFHHQDCGVEGEVVGQHWRIRAARGYAGVSIARQARDTQRIASLVAVSSAARTPTN